LELETLTGTTEIQEQIAWLREQRIAFLVGVDRLPKVIWQNVIDRLSPTPLPDPYGEFLREDELVALVGAKTRSRQIEWLITRGWRHEVNAAGRPMVGRVYARLKLAGVRPNATAAVDEAWVPDFSKVK